MSKVDDILGLFDQPKLLNHGGQKIVYMISHPKHGACVLKIGFYSSKNALERIEREVSILRDISSTFFPKQFDFRVVDSTRYYIIEEFINGHTLDKAFNQFKEESTIVTLLQKLLIALRLLWNKNIVHRDIKPQNLIITNGSICVLDLGIARVIDQTSLTCSYAPFGPCTPNYASPEQLENRKSDIDYRTDQFSLGIIVSQLMLEGQHPFDPNLIRNGSSIPDNIVNDRWARDNVKEKCSGKMYVIIQRLLGHEPYQRFRNLNSLQSLLSEIMENGL